MRRALPVLLVLSCSPGEPAASPQRVQLELVRGLRAVEPRPPVLRRPLATQPPAGLDASHLPEGDWRWGEAPLTKTEGVPFAVAADRSVAWVDSDRDGRLESSERHEPARHLSRVAWFDVEGVVRQPDGDGVAEELTPLAIGIPPPPASQAFSRLDAYRRGTLEVDGRDVPIAIVDRTHRGWFSHRHRDALLVDADGDGRLTTSPDSHERFRLGRPFPVGERDLVVLEISPLGREIVVGASPEPARRLPSLESGAPAPDFDVKTLEGKTLSSSELRGRWVLLDFWATWCRPCIAELPHLKALREQLPRVLVLGVSGDRSRATLERFVSARGVDWPQVFDAEAGLTRDYRVRSFPRSFLLAPDGTIAARDLRGSRLVERVRAVMERHRPDEGPQSPAGAGVSSDQGSSATP